MLSVCRNEAYTFIQGHDTYMYCSKRGHIDVNIVTD